MIRQFFNKILTAEKNCHKYSNLSGKSHQLRSDASNPAAQALFPLPRRGDQSGDRRGGQTDNEPTSRVDLTSPRHDKMTQLHPPTANCLPHAATDDALCGGLLALRLCANRNLPAPKNEPRPNNRFPRHFDAQRPIQRRRRNGLRPSPAAKSTATTHNRRAKSARRLQRANRLSTEGPNPKAAPPSARACLAHPSTAARQTWDRPAQKARPASPPPTKKAKPPADIVASPSKPGQRNAG